MVTTVQRWGNSLAVRIPKAFADQARLSEDTDVEISIDGDRIILAPAQREWKLHDLVSKISPSNTHGETDWGDRKGNESW
ncbi:MAG: AbrB/MazE/SpoVT family DNA-binding domain-containing protein [Gemmatimonadaceae bacterium]